jgi:hypothetical protein
MQYISQCKRCLRLLGMSTKRPSMQVMFDWVDRHDDPNEHWNRHLERCQGLPHNGTWKYYAVEHLYLVTRNRAKKLR